MSKIKIALSLVLCVLLMFASERVFSAQAKNPPVLEKVSLQLKWFHQFQFAGYYAAKEQGYYAAEGLDVEIRERVPEKDVVQQVLTAQADFGIGDSGILNHYAKGDPIIALAAIFQHNPSVFIAKESSGIVSPYEMAGKRIMYDFIGSNDAPLRAVLMDANLDQTQYQAIKHTFNNDDFVTGKVDVMSGYLTDQVFLFRHKGLKINVINPQSYGIDLYSDILFTTTQQVEQHPERVEKFRRASLKGWHYALAHPEELVQLIHAKYHSKLSLDHLHFEAQATANLILPDAIPLGQIDVRRLQKVAQIYHDLKFARHLTENDLAKFIYSRQPLELTAAEQAWLKAHPVIRVGVDNNFAPYEWVDKKGDYVGLVADYFARFEQRLGVKFSFIKDKPWFEIMTMARTGELDMVAAAVETRNG